MRNAIAVMALVVISVGVAGATSLFDETQVAGQDGTPGERDVLSSFPSPGERPMGLVWAFGGLFHVDEAKGDVYHVEPGGSATHMFSVLEQIGYPDSQDCGNGICDEGENMASCPEDCMVMIFCGDGICNGQETMFTCSEDCSPFPIAPNPSFPGDT